MARTVTPSTPDEEQRLLQPFNVFSRALVHRLAIPLLLLVIGGALGGWLRHERPGTYSAHTAVEIGRGLVGFTSGSGVGQGLTINPQTEAQVASSTEVADDVKTSLHSADSVTKLLGRLQVGTPAAADTLTLTYTADSAAQAEAGANAFAQDYLKVRTATLEAMLANARVSIERQVTQTSGSTSQLHTELAQLAAVVVDPGAVITAASTSSRSGLPSVAFPIAGALIGFLLGWAVAVMIERSRQPIRATDDLRGLGIDVLGQYRDGDQAALERIATEIALLVTKGRAHDIILSEPTSARAIGESFAAALQDRGLLMGEETRTGTAPPPIQVLRDPAARGSEAQQEASRRLRLRSVPSLFVSIEGLLQASDADGVILTVERKRTRAPQVIALLRDLRRLEVEVLGAILR
jgi:capsular polysaccharide biosynthesis protein